MYIITRFVSRVNEVNTSGERCGKGLLAKTVNTIILYTLYMGDLQLQQLNY